MKKLDTATGTIAGLIVGAVIGLLIFGADDYDNAPWKVTAGLLLIGGIAGFLIGRNAENKRYQGR